MIKNQENPKEIFISFVTKLGNEFQVSASKLKISLETDDRQLEQILKQFSHNLKDYQFDFIVLGEILQGKLIEIFPEDFSFSEQTLEIEYILKVKKPNLSKVSKTDSGILKIFLQQEKLFSLSFQGHLIDYDFSLNKNKEIQLKNKFYEEPMEIYCSELVQNDKGNFLLVSDNFCNLFSFKLNEEFQQTKQNLIETNGETFTQILNNPFGNQIFAGTKEGKILCLQIDQNYEKIQSILNLAQVSQREINNLIYKDENSLILTSLENNIKIVDTNQLLGIRDFYFKSQTPTAIDFFQDKILTGFSQGQISIFDTRENGKQQNFQGGKMLVSQAKFNKENSFQFATSDYQGNIYIFDTRSNKAVYQIQTQEQEKIFSLEWINKTHLVSGSSEGKILLHEFQ